MPESDARSVTQGVTRYTQFYIDRGIPQTERVSVLDRFFIIFISPPDGQPHALPGGPVSISGERMLTCETLVLTEDGPRGTIQLITTF